LASTVLVTDPCPGEPGVKGEKGDPGIDGAPGKDGLSGFGNHLSAVCPGTTVATTASNPQHDQFVKEQRTAALEFFGLILFIIILAVSILAIVPEVDRRRARPVVVTVAGG